MTPTQARPGPFCEDGKWVEGGTRLCGSVKDNTREAVRPETSVDRQRSSSSEINMGGTTMVTVAIMIGGAVVTTSTRLATLVLRLESSLLQVRTISMQGGLGRICLHYSSLIQIQIN